MAEETRVGIMGGTFDPIHFAHLAIAEEAKYRFDLQEVIFLPTGAPPHKRDYAITAARHRLNMTRLAIEDNLAFRISRLEIDRPGISYTIDTLKELKEQHPENSYYFITGADAVLEILTWKEPQQVAESCRLIAATRPGYDLGGFREKIGEKIFSLVAFLEAPGLNISSTEIRRRVTIGAPIRYLVPEQVRSYIEQESLYRK